MKFELKTENENYSKSISQFFGTVFFSIFIPIAFITTIPSEVFLGLSQLWKILLEVIVAAVFLITSRKFWLFALKFYSSASS